MKNMKIGKFIKDTHGQLHGKINALGVGSISLIAKPVTSVSGKPYFKLIADPMMEAYEIGAAFPKEKEGRTYYVVSLDSPVFQAAMNAALFPDKNSDNIFNLVWNRTELTRLSSDAILEAQQPRRYKATNPSATL